MGRSVHLSECLNLAARSSPSSCFFDKSLRILCQGEDKGAAEKVACAKSLPPPFFLFGSTWASKDSGDFF